MDSLMTFAIAGFFIIIFISVYGIKKSMKNAVEEPKELYILPRVFHRPNQCTVPLCKGSMKKTTVIEMMNNTKYQVFECDNCSAKIIREVRDAR